MSYISCTLETNTFSSFRRFELMQNVQDNCTTLLALTPLLAVHQLTSNVLQWHVMYVYNVTCSVDVCLCNVFATQSDLFSIYTRNHSQK